MDSLGCRVHALEHIREAIRMYRVPVNLIEQTHVFDIFPHNCDIALTFALVYIETFDDIRTADIVKKSCFL
jgi:hypothetical protein